LGGRTTVLAFAQGEESFIDTNGNGQYDFNESFVDLTEAILDWNEDGVLGNGDPTVDDSRNAADPLCYGPPAPLTPSTEPICYQNGGDEEGFIDFGDDDPFNNLKDLDEKFNAGNGIYNGTLCPDEINIRTDSCNNGVTSALDPTPDLCDEATEQYCTRDLINIRQEIVILLAGSNPRFSVRDSFTGELISSVDLSGGVGPGKFRTSAALVSNDGTPIAGDFSIGFGNSDVAPGIGEVTSLTSGSGSVRIDFADLFNGRMATGTNVAVTADAEGCVVLGSPGGALTDSNALGGVGIFVSLGVPSTPGGGANVRATVTSVKGIGGEIAFFCQH
jgi:hypothetical protein